jgi:copper chaperone CopZ
MKTIILSAILFAGFNLFSQEVKKQTDTLLVSGNCEMCEKNIEESLLVKGVKSADWNMATHVLTVSYNPSKITLTQIHHLVAMSGYETSREKADATAYQNLPKCCQYKK